MWQQCAIPKKKKEEKAFVPVAKIKTTETH
jgi:hypothetical protein